MTSVDWPGRMQRLTQGALVDLAPRGAEIWLDGGHNPGAGVVVAEALAEQEERKSRPLFLIAGMINTKDQTGYFRAFKGIARHVFTVPVGSSEAGVPNAELASRAADAGLSAEPVASVANALMLLRDTWDGLETPPQDPDRRLALSCRRSAGRKRHAAGVEQVERYFSSISMKAYSPSVALMTSCSTPSFAEIGSALLHLREALAVLGHHLQLAVHRAAR